MKNNLILLLVLLVSLGTANAKGIEFGKKYDVKNTKSITHLSPNASKMGNIIVSFGYGYPNISKSILGSVPDNPIYTVSGIGPIHGALEYLINDNISLGLTVNHVATEMNWVNSLSGTPYNESLTYSSTAFNFRFNFYFDTGDNLDIFMGAGLGYKKTSLIFKTDDPDFVDLWQGPSLLGLFPISMDFSAGVRYYIIENFGIYVAVGLAKSLVQGGLVFRL